MRGPNQELVDEVKKLGLKYGIVTPYTSFLVTEKERHEVFAADPDAGDAMAGRQVSGGGAVKAAKISLNFKAAPTAVQVESQNILYRDDKTFYLKNGVWTDSEYKDGGPVKEIVFNSDEYFRLAAAKPGITRYLSAGQNLIVVYEGVSYWIAPAK